MPVVPVHSHQPDSFYAWQRLVVSLALSTIGGVGLWSAVVVLPVIEAEFAVDRGGASVPYTATMVGFAIGGILVGRLTDRFGIMLPLAFGSVALAIGFAAAALSASYWQFVFAQALLIGMLGSSGTFGPLVADVSHWFVRQRGIAVAIVASGNYVAGTVWPSMLQYGIETIGWRQTYLIIGVICVATMVPLSLLLRARPVLDDHPDSAVAASASGRMPVSPAALQAILVVAALACCIAMSMPQVHIIAYCADLGYGTGRGAEMLSLILGFGVVSRLVSGLIADRIGGLGTLILGSSLQCMALIFYLPFDGLMSLYIVSTLFGLAQGGIVPSYALIVRDYFPAREAGAKVSLVLMSSVIGMAIGGWMSGEIFDLTGSYQAAFLNGIAFNFLNIGIALWLLFGRSRAGASPAH
ncbi:MAG TPA: MFS transporter [Dongiaceae bacterium]|jgi:MFS family permease